MDLLHHAHETQHCFALQSVHELHDARHADIPLHGIEQGQAAEDLHIGFLLIGAERKPRHLVIAQRDLIIRPELHHILIPELLGIRILRTVPIHCLPYGHR